MSLTHGSERELIDCVLDCTNQPWYLQDIDRFGQQRNQREGKGRIHGKRWKLDCLAPIKYVSHHSK